VKLIFLNRYFHPDISATSQMLSSLAFHLAAEGAEVHVITSRQRYDDPAARLPPREALHGVDAHRVWTSRFGRTHMAGRAIDYLTFYLSAALALALLARRGDVVVAKTDPPLIGVPAAVIARVRGARLVNWLQDVFPEVAARTGVRLARGAAGALLRALRNRSLRSAVVNVVIGERMHAELRSIPGLASARFAVIHNWADGAAIVPVAADANPLREAWGLKGRFVVAYSGNMGRVHEFETILGAAGRLRERPGIVFLFIGDGHQRAWIEREATGRNLANVRFQPYQPRQGLGESLGVADLHLTSLQPAMEGLLVPSKVYGILASGRPVLHVGEAAGEVGRILSDARAGFTVATGDPGLLAQRIEALESDPALRAELGANARIAFDALYGQGIAHAQWSRLLQEAGAGTSDRIAQRNATV
jgi:glycosyltransferase involved in cell wall biosynthesis